MKIRWLSMLVGSIAAATLAVAVPAATATPDSSAGQVSAARGDWGPDYPSEGN